MNCILKTVPNKKKVLFYYLFYLILNLIAQPQKIENHSEVRNKIIEYKQYIIESMLILSKFIFIDFTARGQGNSDTKRFVLKQFKSIREKCINSKTQSIKELPKMLSNYLCMWDKWDEVRIKFKSRLESGYPRNGEMSDSWVKFLFMLIEIELSNALKGGNFPTYEEISLEHIMPKSYQNNWVDDLKEGKEISDNELEIRHKEHLEMLGNYLILNKKINSKLQNKRFIEKLKMYEDYSISHLFNSKKIGIDEMDFAIGNYKKWNFNSIKERDEKIKKFMLKKLFNSMIFG